MALQAERTETPGYNAPRQWWPGYLLAALLLVVGGIGGIVFRGHLGQFMLAGLQVIPFALLALFAYLGLRQAWARVLSCLYLGVVLLGLGGFALLLMFGSLVAREGLLAGTADPSRTLAALTHPRMGAVSLWSLVGFAVAGIALIPGVRRALARILPLDPASSVHAIALSVVSGATTIGIGQLIAAGGVPPLLELVEASSDAAASAADTDQLLGLIYGFAWTVPGALMAVGFPVVRSLRGALHRLGLVRPTLHQVGGAIVIALLMVGGASVLDTGIGYVWQTLGWQRTDTAAFERLLGAAISPIGAVLIGITAGIGEEMVVRGALQPRLGIFLSNLFFTSLHAFQYGFDALLSVFIIGLVLGLVRKRSNTTTSSIVHGVYDFVVVMIAALGLFQ